MRRQLLAGMVGALLVLGTPATGAQERFIVVSSTTSTEQSGLFGHILPLSARKALTAYFSGILRVRS